MLHRRNFLTGLAALVASPAVVKASSLMPVKSIIVEPDPWDFGSGDFTIEAWLRRGGDGWVAIAAERDQGRVQFFMDGGRVATSTIPKAHQDFLSGVRFGHLNDGAGLLISDVRITKGVACYSGALPHLETGKRFSDVSLLLT